MLSRRTILQYGLLGAGVLAVAGTGLALRGTVARVPSAPLRALSPTQYSIVWAVAECLHPGAPGLPPASALGVAAKVDAYLSTTHPAVVAEVGQALMLLENALAGLVLDGRPRTFTASTPVQQAAVLEAWRGSRITLKRRVFKSLRLLCATSYWSDPATFAHTGYPGAPDYGQRADSSDPLRDVFLVPPPPDAVPGELDPIPIPGGE